MSGRARARYHVKRRRVYGPFGDGPGGRPRKGPWESFDTFDTPARAFAEAAARDGTTPELYEWAVFFRGRRIEEPSHVG